MIKNYICPVCHKKFSDYQKRTTCSKQCSALFQKKQITKPCAECGKNITDVISRFTRAKNVFCNKKCVHNYEKHARVKFIELRNKQWCLDQYKKHTLAEIAELLGCGETVVWKHFNIHDINRDRSKWLLNTPKSIEHRNNLSISRINNKLSVGPKNPNWKNGISKLGHIIRSMKEYINWKNKVLEKNKKICVLCGSTNNLEVDHIKKFSFILSDCKIKNVNDARNCVELWNVDNGRILCKRCNLSHQ